MRVIVRVKVEVREKIRFMKNREEIQKKFKMLVEKIYSHFLLETQI